MEPSLIQYIGKFHENNIYMKREDLLPFSFGGNKLRIANEFFKDMESRGCDCIIGYGNARSNLSRAIANIAAAKKICCVLVSPSDNDGSKIETANSRMTSLCGAEIIHCEKANVAETIDYAIDHCRQKGFNPYYINGNKYGHGNESVPVRAYDKVYQELQSQKHDLGIQFDYIFHASGTGMTQSGLIAGKCSRGGQEKIIGISIARKKKEAEASIFRYLSAWGGVFATDDIAVIDDYLCGGYALYNKQIEETVHRILIDKGIPMDTTYVGKAFYGMEEHIKKENIREKNILFIHTGGTPLFFDDLNKENLTVTKCEDLNSLVKFLYEIDKELPTPLSIRVDIPVYASKVLSQGNVFVIEKNNKICAGALFYCNDQESKTGFLSLLAVVPESRRQGFASTLLNAMEKEASQNGMLKLELLTDISNTAAISLYSRYGYRIVETSEKIRMRKELSE